MGVGRCRCRRTARPHAAVGHPRRTVARTLFQNAWSIGVGSRLPVLAEGNTRSTKSALGESAADERCGRCGAGALGHGLSSQRADGCASRHAGCSRRGAARAATGPHRTLQTPRGHEGSAVAYITRVTVAYAGRDLRPYCDILLRAIVCAGQGSETGEVSQRGRDGFREWGFKGMASTLAAWTGVGMGRKVVMRGAVVNGGGGLSEHGRSVDGSGRSSARRDALCAKALRARIGHRTAVCGGEVGWQWLGAGLARWRDGRNRTEAIRDGKWLTRPRSWREAFALRQPITAVGMDGELAAPGRQS